MYMSPKHVFSIWTDQMRRTEDQVPTPKKHTHSHNLEGHEKGTKSQYASFAFTSSERLHRNLIALKD